MSDGPELELRRTAWRIATQTTALLLVCLLVVGTLMFVVVVRGQTRVIDAALTSATLGTDGGDADVGTAVLQGDRLRRADRLPADLPDVAVMEQVRASGKPDRRNVRIAADRFALLTVRRDDQVIQAVYPLDELYSERERLLTALGVGGGVGILLATLVAAWLADRAVRPMGEALRLQRRFVADASHELRTPLTLLSTRSQLLRRRLEAGPRTTGTQDRGELDRLIRQDADGFVADSRALAAILEELLLAADTRTPVPAEPVDLTGLVTEAVSAAQASADERSLALRTVVGGPVVIPAGSSTALKRAVTALVDNALAHARSCVEVSVSQERDRATIQVSDDGPGILTSYSPASSNGSPAVGRRPAPHRVTTDWVWRWPARWPAATAAT